MKHLLLTTIAAVVLVGCGESQQSAPAPEAKPVEPVAEAAKPEPTGVKAPDISIHDAAIDGNIEAVKQHLADGADVNATDDMYGRTHLYTATVFGHKEVVELLIAAGADVNADEGTGLTPLHSAARHGHKEIVELLIANGADVNVKDILDVTPLDKAEDKEMADLLRKHGGKTGEELKAATPEPPTVKAPDISPRTPDILPTSPIHDAAYEGNIEAVKEYLAAGGLLPHPWDVNAKNDRGSTPLHYAAKEGSKEVAKLLIAKSADVNAKNDFWSTPLHHAAWNGRTEIAEMLIAAGADVNAKDDKGRTPLDLATQRKKTETADILRKHGGKTGEELKAEGK